MNYTVAQTRVHAVIVIKGPKEIYDPEKLFMTTCKRKLPFKNMVKSRGILKSASQCSFCYQASKNQLALPRGWEIIYLHE